jgi:hypothetical protein
MPKAYFVGLVASFSSVRLGVVLPTQSPVPEFVVSGFLQELTGFQW